MNGHCRWLAASPRIVQQGAGFFNGHHPSSRLLFALGWSLLLHVLLVVLTEFSGSGRYITSATVTANSPAATVNLVVSRSGPAMELPESDPATPLSPEVSTKDISPDFLDKGDSRVEEPVRAEDTAFHPRNRLTKRPQPLGIVEIDGQNVPASDNAGKVLLELWIDKTGRVSLVTTLMTELTESGTKAMADGFRKLKFRPGEIDGRPVGTVIKIEARYEDVGVQER